MRMTDAPLETGDALVALPPAGLYVHIPFCVSLCPYCDFVVVAGAASRGPANRIAAFVAALQADLALRADDLDARFGPPGSATRPPLDTVYLGGGTPTLLSAETIAELLDTVRRRYGIAASAEVTIEANPGPDERGDAAALARVRHQPDLVRRPEPRFGRAATARSPPSAPPRRRRRGGGPRGRDRLGQPRPPVRRARRLTRDLDRHPGVRPRAPARSPVALRPDPRRPRRRGPDRRRRRPPPDDPRSPPLARPRDPRPGRGSRRRPVPPRRASARGGRLARLRDQQLGPPRPREPP